MNDGSAAARPLRDHALSTHVLVLNRNYAAVRIVSARRAFTLLYRNSAQAIDAREEQFDVLDFQGWLTLSQERRTAPGGHDQFVLTPRFAILVPRVIRLVTYDKVPRREVRFSRRNVLARDDH